MYFMLGKSYIFGDVINLYQPVNEIKMYLKSCERKMLSGEILLKLSSEQMLLEQVQLKKTYNCR